MGNIHGIQEFEFIFEGDFGMVVELIEASGLKAATNELKERYPDDIGADGHVVLEDGTECAINW